MPLADLLDHARPVVASEQVALEGPHPAYTLFFSLCDGKRRAHVVHASADDFATAWSRGAEAAERLADKNALAVRWLRIDWISAVEPMTWQRLDERLAKTKRNYFRHGLALDADFERAFLEQELNANAMLYGGNQLESACLNPKNFEVYAGRRYGKDCTLEFDPAATVFVLSTRGVFCEDGAPPHLLGGAGPDVGRRLLPHLAPEDVDGLIRRGSNFLARQVQASGRFVYGYHPCFDREIRAYNALRHASTTYAMIEAWEHTRDDALKASIDRALHYLTHELIREIDTPEGARCAFVVDTGDEIKLGANAVAILALVKYSETTASNGHLPLLERLALGICHMQDTSTGAFSHVLDASNLSVRQAFRIIYYDGEAAFGLMRLYGLTGDDRWLAAVEKAFEHFIAAGHDKAHDHWLSYCVNELTRHRPDERYFRFGLRNVADYLDFVLTRQTTFPTLLELMMAAEQMLRRLDTLPALRHLLAEIDLDKFYRALQFRAHHLLNGHFWPEIAMYFRNPERIVGSFFIRHHAFRVRIDDVEHYLSGFIAYDTFLRSGALARPVTALASMPPRKGPVVVWGGDVNLGRRQHYRACELGFESPLRDLPALHEANLSIVNLECVVSTLGEQGISKGEGGPYYYRARPEMLKVLISAGIDIVTTANNHSGDYGPSALLEQRDWLDALGIGHTGSGDDLNAALTPVVRRTGDLNVAVFAVDSTQPRFAAKPDRPGNAYLDLEPADAWSALLAPRITAARKRAHVVLVAVHWGANFEAAPRPTQIAAGHALIDAGADAVLGASAHVLQGIEIYKGRPIIHNAGDLLFDSVRDSLADCGLFGLEIGRCGVERVTFTPVGAGFGFSRQYAGDEARARAHAFAEKCRILGTSATTTTCGRAFVDLDPAPRPHVDFVPAPVTRFDSSALDLIRREARQEWLVRTLPEEVRIDPIQFGPLRLIGLRITPNELVQRRMLFVESFWSCESTPTEDMRLDIRAEPVGVSAMPAWGEGMDHDPCDWMWPTTKWKRGIVYRDYYGLRPPPMSRMENTELRIHVGIRANSGNIGPVPLPHTVHVNIPNLPPRTTVQPALVPSYRTNFPDIIHDCKPGETWTAQQLEAVTGGRWLVKPPSEWFVQSVIRGSSHLQMVSAPVLYAASDYLTLARHEQYGDMNKVLQNNWDSHHKLKQIHSSLSGAIVARQPSGLPDEFPLLLVDDPIKALIELGIAARDRFKGTLVSVTGSAGKTSTLHMLTSAFSSYGAFASYDNYNSRVGMLSMLASVSSGSAFVFLETALSAINSPGFKHVKFVRPDIGIITNIAPAHLRSGETTKDIARKKANLFQGMLPGSIAMLCTDTEHFDILINCARMRQLEVLKYGTASNADIVLEKYEPRTQAVLVRIGDQSIDFRLPVPGRHMAINSLACFGVALARNIPIETICEGLSTVSAQKGRGDLHRIDMDGKLVTLIDESYNANPASMRAALECFADLDVGRGRKLLVLGDMLELGPESAQYHQQMVRHMLACRPAIIFLLGEQMRALQGSLGRETRFAVVNDIATLESSLLEEIRNGDSILFKSSNGMQLHAIVRKLCGTLN